MNKNTTIILTVVILAAVAAGGWYWYQNEQKKKLAASGSLPTDNNGNPAKGTGIVGSIGNVYDAAQQAWDDIANLF